jgi:hypothetical protein
MTRIIEDQASEYLINEFTHSDYEFVSKRPGDKGFDLWMLEKIGQNRTKAELKAHSGTYSRPSNLFENLIFNSEIERELFEAGETVIVRVFMGANPFRVFVITNAILSNGANLKPEARYVLRGKINYSDSFTELA